MILRPSGRSSALCWPTSALHFCLTFSAHISARTNWRERFAKHCHMRLRAGQSCALLNSAARAPPVGPMRTASRAPRRPAESGARFFELGHASSLGTLRARPLRARARFESAASSSCPCRPRSAQPPPPPRSPEHAPLRTCASGFHPPSSVALRTSRQALAKQYKTTGLSKLITGTFEFCANSTTGPNLS